MSRATSNLALRLQGIRVLLVDDETDSREVCAAILSDCGAHVVTAASAREALVTLRAFAPSVLVSDIGMPEEDGCDLIRAVRASDGVAAMVPSLALTAFTSASQQARVRAAGFDAFLPKPTEIEALISTISRLSSRGLSHDTSE